MAIIKFENNSSAGKIGEARHILDLILCSEDREIILTDLEDPTVCKLRQEGVELYRLAAKEALKNGTILDARDCFQQALSLQVFGYRKWPMTTVAQYDETSDNFDICVFDDLENMASQSLVAEKMSQVSSAVVRILMDLFGMR